ncbi:hypothetical protein C0993_008254, partial [Termitomyces sp. T159_Od127]
LTSVDPNLVVHPLQLQEYIQYDNDICRRNVTTNIYVPAGYAEFAAAYNSSKGDNPCEFTTWDENSSSYNVDNFAIPPSLLLFPYCDPRYTDFRIFGPIKTNGDIDTDHWDMVKNALLRPHRNAVHIQARIDSRREEKANKKRRYEEAYPQGFHVGSSSFQAHKGRRSHQGKGSSSPTNPDAEGNALSHNAPQNPTSSTSLLTSVPRLQPR